MVSAPRLLADAVAMGVVTAADAHAGAASVTPTPRSNAVHRVDLRGMPVGYVKQAGTASLVDGDDTVRVEQAVLARLAARGFTPASVAGARAGTVWTRAAEGEDLAVAVARRPALLDEVATTLGERLAAWARLATSTAARRAATPWPLLPELLPSMELAPHNDDLEYVLEATVDPDVRRAVALAAGEWHAANGFVHGDVSRNNVVVGGTGIGEGPLRLTFIDLEACGAGHPAWDVVSAVEALTEVDERPESPSHLAFRTAYAAAGGDAWPSPAWTCVRSLVTAWQYGVNDLPDRSDRVAAALGRALASAREVS